VQSFDGNGGALNKDLLEFFEEVHQLTRLHLRYRDLGGKHAVSDTRLVQSHLLVRECFLHNIAKGFEPLRPLILP
jgi:hypothetical protein